MVYQGIIFTNSTISTTISSNGKILIKPFQFTIDYDGFYLLLSKFTFLYQNSIIIILESIALYSNKFIHSL